ncbi:MAG: YHYH protein [Trueperaceae bacterium]
MKNTTRVLALFIIVFALVALFTSIAQDTESATSVINLDAFDRAGLVQEPEVVDCTLVDGTETQCAQLVVKYLPDGFETGPYCPATLADEGGIWDWDGDNPGVYRLNEAFWKMLDEQGFSFYDEAGNINIANPGAGGGRPGSGNYCLEASEDNTVEATVLIPLQPVLADSPTQLDTVAQVGLALSSIPIFADAPSVLDTGNLPALDTCGGHIDPGGWYHWHATATDIDSSFAHEGVEAHCHLEQSASELFSYAFDGYPIYGSSELDGHVPTDLDECNGHIGATPDYPEGVYHYHASLEFPNLPTCLVGTSAEGAFRTTASGGIGSGPGGGGPGGGPGGRPDFSAAAAQLGVTEEELMAALGEPPFDLEAAAEKLGMTSEELEQVLPPPPGN